MYTLYFMPDACSLATHSILNELGQSFDLIHKQDAPDYSDLNPVGTVPVLVAEQQVLNEGVAILLHLLDKHDNSLLAREGAARQKAIENMMFANASMHPAYSRLFFTNSNISNAEGKQQSYAAAAEAISQLWAAVENKLAGKTYLGGDSPSPADFLLTVYSRWGQFFPVEINIGPNAQRMIAAISNRDSFQQALARETAYSTAA